MYKHGYVSHTVLSLRYFILQQKVAGRLNATFRANRLDNQTQLNLQLATQNSRHKTVKISRPLIISPPHVMLRFVRMAYGYPARQGTGCVCMGTWSGSQ